MNEEDSTPVQDAIQDSFQISRAYDSLGKVLRWKVARSSTPWKGKFES